MLRFLIMENLSFIKQAIIKLLSVILCLDATKVYKKTAKKVILTLKLNIIM